MSWHKDNYSLKQIVDELFLCDMYDLEWEYEYPELRIVMKDRE
jgi:hypothetical protein|tara:strand:- start:170 stop:298 length:129 start_codon:yes stop_codon:yes gene_type:complete